MDFSSTCCIDILNTLLKLIKCGLGVNYQKSLYNLMSAFNTTLEDVGVGRCSLFFWDSACILAGVSSMFFCLEKCVHCFGFSREPATKMLGRLEKSVLFECAMYHFFYSNFQMPCAIYKVHLG